MTKERKTDTTETFLYKIVIYVSGIIGLIVGQYLGIVFVLEFLIIFVSAWLIGRWFPKWYLKRRHTNTTIVKWIVWSNIFTWLIPPLGVMTGFATLEFANHFPGNHKKYKIIAIITLLVSFLSVVVGMLKVYL